MNNSNDKELTELPQVDYSKLPKEIEDAIENKPYIIEKKVKLTQGNKQFLIRIPTEIANEMKLTSENMILFRLIKPLPHSMDKPQMEMTLIQ
jgi:hypothetical protein